MGSEPAQKSSKGHPCKDCNKLFAHKPSLSRHKSAVHKKPKTYLCDECYKQFTQSSTLARHKKDVHEKLKPYKCEVCGQPFSQKSSLTQHLRCMHKPVEYTNQLECAVCNETFPHRDAAVQHQRRAHNDDAKKFHECKKCHKLFRIPADLRRHTESVHKKLKPHQCEMCNRHFTQKASLEVHTKCYCKENPSATRHKKNFTYDDLKKHNSELGEELGSEVNHDMLQVHQEGEDVSQQSSDLGNWKEEGKLDVTPKEEPLESASTAQEEKPLKCELCKIAFTQEDDFRKHTQYVHAPMEMFPCGLCKTIFLNGDTLQKHLEADHKQKI